MRRLVCVFCIAASHVHAQAVTTIAGAEWKFPPTPLPAVDAPLNRPTITSDLRGGLVVRDPGNSFDFHIDSRGTLDRLAQAYVVATGRSLVDSRGFGYATDGNSRIFRVYADGRLEDLVNGVSPGFSGDGGPAIRAATNRPAFLALDANDNLYFADRLNHRIRRITPNGLIETICGTGTNRPNGGNGSPASAATLGEVRSLAVVTSADGSPEIFFGEAGNFGEAGTTRRFEPGGAIQLASLGDLVATGPNGILIMVQSDVVRRRSADGLITDIAGNRQGIEPTAQGTPAMMTKLGAIDSLAVDPTGEIFLIEKTNRILKLDPAGTIRHCAGNGRFRLSPEPLHASTTQLTLAGALAIDALGQIYYADQNSGGPGGRRVFRIDRQGNIRFVAGGGTVARPANGASAATLFFITIHNLAADNSGNVIISADSLLWRIGPDGRVTLLPSVVGCRGFTLTPSGFILCPEQGRTFLNVPEGRVWRLDPRDTPSPPVVVRRSTAYLISDLAVDALENIYFIEPRTRQVVRIDEGGTFTPIAGTPPETPARPMQEGVPATTVTLRPTSLAVDSTGNVFIREGFQSSVILVVSRSGIIRTALGGPFGTWRDGAPPLEVWGEIISPLIMHADTLYFASPAYIRALVRAPTLSAPTGEIRLSAGSNSDTPTHFDLPVSASVAGVSYRVELESNTAGGWLRIPYASNFAPSALRLVASPQGLDPGVYTALVRIRSAQTTPDLITVPVRFTVTAPDLTGLRLDAAAVHLNAVAGGPPSRWRIGAQGATGLLTASGGAPWLAAIATGASRLDLTADPRELNPGVYHTEVIVRAPTGVPAAVQVVFAVHERLQRRPAPLGLWFDGVGAQPPIRFSAGESSRTTTSTNALRLDPVENVPGARDAYVDPFAPPFEGRILVQPAGEAPFHVPVWSEPRRRSEGKQVVSYPAALLVSGAAGALPVRTRFTLFAPAGDAAIAYTVFPSGFAGDAVTVTPVRGSLSSGQARTFDVQVALALLRENVNHGGVLIEFSNGTRLTVPLTALSIPFNCLSRERVAVLRAPSSGAAVRVGRLLAFEAQVVDNCGRPILGGDVQVSFDNGSPPIPLEDDGSGIYVGGWSPLTLDPGSTIRASLGHRDSVSLNAGPPTSSPVVEPPASPIAPGARFTLRGTNLTGSLDGYLAGKPLELIERAPDRVVFSAPFELKTGVAMLELSADGTISPPLAVSVVPVAPTIIGIVRRDDALVIEATGLGQMDPETRRVLAPISVLVDKAEVMVESATWTGAGLYQIICRWPEGAPPAARARVELQAGGSISPITLLP